MLPFEEHLVNMNHAALRVKFNLQCRLQEVKNNSYMDYWLKAVQESDNVNINNSSTVPIVYKFKGNINISHCSLCASKRLRT